jgi:hypothetical protein
LPSRYRSVHDYLERLPDGIDSHPHCVAKASLLSHALRSRPIAPPPGSLPEAVHRLIEQPPPVSAWVPEVPFNAAVLAIYDEVFGGEDLRGFEDWVCDFNRALFANPLYRVLFALVSPARLVSLAASRWSAFHRGSSLVRLEHRADFSRLRLGFPSRLFGHVMLVGFTAGVRAAAMVAGARAATGKLETATDTFAEYSVRWTM